MRYLRSSAISVGRLPKKYANGTTALNGVRFEVEEHTILCIGGPNGAGKTTLLRIIGTQLLPSEGDVTVCGINALAHARAARRLLGVVPQEAQPDPMLTVWEHIYFYLRVRGESRPSARRKAADAIEVLGLDACKKALVRSLSGGQRQRVLVAMAMATEAKILILDEPTASLDPLARAQVWENLRRLKQRSTIVVTSHSMHEVDALADRLIILKEGKVIVDDTPASLKQDFPWSERVEIDSSDRAAYASYGRVQAAKGSVVVYPFDPDHRDRLVRKCMEERIGIKIGSTSLDDVYVAAVKGVDLASARPESRAVSL